MKKAEEKIYKVLAESLQRQDPEPHKLSKQAKKEGEKERLETLATQLVEDSCQDGEGWKLVTCGNRREVPAPPANQLQNRLSALTIGEDKQDLSGDASEPTSADKPHVCSEQ